MWPSIISSNYTTNHSSTHYTVLIENCHLTSHWIFISCNNSLHLAYMQTIVFLVSPIILLVQYLSVYTTVCVCVYRFSQLPCPTILLLRCVSVCTAESVCMYYNVCLHALLCLIISITLSHYNIMYCSVCLYIQNMYCIFWIQLWLNVLYYLTICTTSLAICIETYFGNTYYCIYLYYLSWNKLKREADAPTLISDVSLCIDRLCRCIFSFFQTLHSANFRTLSTKANHTGRAWRLLPSLLESSVSWININPRRIIICNFNQNKTWCQNYLISRVRFHHLKKMPKSV